MSGSKGGYTGRFLRIDLDTSNVQVEETPDPEKWLGARGWNALMAWKEVPPGVGPFDPQNRIVFSAGPLVGTGAPTAGRITVSTVAPRGYPEPMWTSASLGGYFGAELKHAGYDGIVIHGKADAPCYLLIEDAHVSLEDASHLWGQGTFDTQRELKNRHGIDHQIAAIGPAGENRVRFASIIHRLSNAIGNGGFGGVMGAKNLKAIAVRGTRGVSIADPEGFLDAVGRVTEITRGGLGGIGKVEEGYPVVACTHSCTMPCHARIAPTPGKLNEAARTRMMHCVNNAFVGGSHPGYEGEHVNGQKLSVPRPTGLGDVGLDLGNLAEDMGMTAWLYDTWYRYLGGLQQLGIHDLLGEPFDLEDPVWWRDFMLKTAYRRGVGDDVAEGLIRFHDKHEIGPRYLVEFVESAGSRGHGWHRDGRAMEPHPSPFWEFSALLYATSTRDVTPSTHGFFFLNRLYGYPDSPKDPDEIPKALKLLAERVYGSRKAAYPGNEKVAHVTAWHQHRAIIKDSLGVCDWIFPILRRSFSTEEELETALENHPMAIYGNPAAEAELYRHCTGIDLDIDTMERPMAERIVNLERCLDIRNFDRSRQVDEWVIPHYQWPEKTDGTHISAKADEFRALLDRYYDLRGWDRETGIPKRERLVALELDEIAKTSQLTPK